MYKKEKEAEYKKIFNDCYKKIKESGGVNDVEHRMQSTLEDGIVLMKITPEAFKTQDWLEDFLLLMADRLNDMTYDIGIVLGHLDKDDFLWTEEEFNQKDNTYWLEFMEEGNFARNTILNNISRLHFV